MTETPFDQISRFYDSRVAQYGHDPKACDYGRAESQRRKFQVLGDVCNLSDRSILDVGCGFADYSDYLSSRYDNTHYEGIDLSIRMIECAKKTHPSLNLCVENILDNPVSPTLRYDVVNANGIFYLLGQHAAELMPRLVAAMFGRARVAVAFNSLSTWANTIEANEYHADPLETVAWCRQITPWVVLRHEYMPHDFTIFLYRERVMAL